METTEEQCLKKMAENFQNCCKNVHPQTQKGHVYQTENNKSKFIIVILKLTLQLNYKLPKANTS